MLTVAAAIDSFLGPLDARRPSEKRPLCGRCHIRRLPCRCWANGCLSGQAVSWLRQKVVSRDYSG